MGLLQICLLAVALEVSFRALASPPPPPLNNFRFQFNIRDGDEGPSSPTVPQVTETVVVVERVTVIGDPGDAEQVQVADVEPDSPVYVAEEDVASPAAADPVVKDDDDVVQEDDIFEDPDTADTVDTNSIDGQDEDQSLPFNENLYSTNPAESSEEMEIKRLEREILFDLIEKRDELCAVCFAVVSRHSKPMVSEEQYKKALNSNTWKLAHGTHEYLMIHGLTTSTPISTRTAKSICNELVPNKFKWRIKRSVLRTKGVVKWNGIRGLETTGYERRNEAYRRLESSFGEIRDNFRCDGDYRAETAYIRGILEELSARPEGS